MSPQEEDQTNCQMAASSQYGDGAPSAPVESALMQSPPYIPEPSTPNLKCCCGSTDCAFLQHNNVALEGLERDVHTAAQLGQALLVRHEAYMVDAEKERERMNAAIERLEHDKKMLEEENARRIEENRDLLDQLEHLNHAVTESDSQIESLTATLSSTQQELQRLIGLESRAKQLEVEVAVFEQEQAQLQHSLSSSKEDERTAVQRWRKAERTLAELNEQVEKIEREAKEERERHVEVIGRMERTRAVEELLLTSSTRRIKGAAKTTGAHGNGQNVISHFVKDILQDNVNLQMGIVELRELLEESNQEVYNLREQLSLHQPAETEAGIDAKDDTASPGNLKKEIDSELAKRFSQELHVHHHYHAPARSKDMSADDRLLGHRKSKKRRSVVSSGLFTPPGSRTPTRKASTPIRPTPLSSTSTPILSETSVSIPPVTPTSNDRWTVDRKRKRISQASSFAPSSVPSSIFDRPYNDGGLDSSRPTSPSSVDPSSPLWTPSHMRHDTDTSFRSFTAPIPFGPSTTEPCVPEEPDAYDHDPRLGPMPDLDAERHVDKAGVPYDTEPFYSEDYYPINDYSSPPAPLRRAASHESLLSISGMDIYASRAQTGWAGNRRSRGFYPRAPSFAPSTITASTAAVVSNTTASASRPAMPARGARDSSSFNRELLGAVEPRSPPRARELPPRDSFGKKLGGWVWNRWGMAPSRKEAETVKRKSVIVGAIDEDALKEAIGE